MLPAKLVVVGRILSECWTLVQHIIKVYHHESGTEVPPYDINKLPFGEFFEVLKQPFTGHNVVNVG